MLLKLVCLQIPGGCQKEDSESACAWVIHVIYIMYLDIYRALGIYISWTKLCPPAPNLHVKALTPNVTVFGGRTFKEVIEVMGVETGVLIRRERETRDVYTQRKGHMRT